MTALPLTVTELVMGVVKLPPLRMTVALLNDRRSARVES